MSQIVSIVMNFLNGERFIDEAIASVFNQTYAYWELLLIDDGSTDQSTAKARKYAAENPERIRYFEHPGHVNKGTSASRNLGFRHGAGKYFAFLDHDDIWLPEKLSCQIDIFQRHPEVAITFGPVYVWYGWTGILEDADRDHVFEMVGGEYNKVIPPPSVLLRHLTRWDGLPPPTAACVRRDIVENVGGFEESFPGMFDDEVFFTKIVLKGNVFVYSQCLERYRQHPDSLSARAVMTGEYNESPSIPNRARERYLRWLDVYLSDNNWSHAELRDALEKELEPYSNST